MWVDFLSHHALRQPHKPALILRYSDRQDRQVWTYAQLDEEANRWATWLSQKGVVREDRVAFWAANCREHLTLFFACTRIGAVFVPLNYRLGMAELEELLAFLQPKVLLADNSWPAGSLQATSLSSIALPYPTFNQPALPSMDQTLLMLFTSGSSGKPKGVELHAGMLQWNAINTHLDWGLTCDDVSVIHTPFFHTGGYNVTCLPLLRLGGSLVLVDRFKPEAMLAILQEEQVSVFFAVPTMFQLMAASPKFAETDFQTLRFCISGGAPCPGALLETYRNRGIPLRQGFGLTEVGPNCFAMTADEALQRPQSIGRPVAHSQVKLVDQTGNPVGDGEIGELCIAGPHVCKGYFRDETRFAEAFRGGFFHTGDLLRRDHDGFYEVVGRRKDMYISGGENVYPGEVVRALLKHPWISNAVVLAVPHPKWGEVGYAFLETQAELQLESICQFLTPLLSRYKQPHHLCCLKELPLLPNNKIDIEALRQLASGEVVGG